MESQNHKPTAETEEKQTKPKEKKKNRVQGSWQKKQ